MENIATSLKAGAASVGLSLRALCKEAGVNKSIISRWEANEPLTIKNLRALQEVIEKRKQEHSDDKDLEDAITRSGSRLV